MDYFPDTEKDGGLRADAIWEDGKRFYQPYHAQMLEQLAFSIDHEHYEDEKGQVKQTSHIQFKDGSLFNMIRHKEARILEKSTYFRVYGVDNIEDPFHADDMKAALHHELDNPEKGWEETKEKIVMGSLACGVWGLVLGFDPNCGLYGSITAKAMRPDRMYWTPGFDGPHCEDCPWLAIEYDMLPREVERMGDPSVPEAIRWRNVENLVADGTAGALGQSNNNASYQTSSASDGPTQVETIKVLFVYERFRKETVKRPRPEQIELEPGQRYMACVACGYNEQGAQVDGAILPPMGGQCPQCGSILKRIDAEKIADDVLAYRKGQSFTVRAPLLKRTFFEGPWPHDLRGFPGMVFKAYTHPLKPIPHSETFYYWTNQQMVNALFRMGYDQMRKSHMVIVAPTEGLEDAAGNPYGFSDYRDIAYYDPTTGMNPQMALHSFQPNGLNAAWPTFLSAVQGSFTVNKGTTDLGLTPTQSRDIPVGTIEAFERTGEIPVDRQIKRFQSFMSIALTRWAEMIRATWTEAKAVRMQGPDGRLMIRRLRGDSLPGVDVIVTAEPDMTLLKDMEAQELMGIIQLPPPARHLIARVKGISRQTLEEYEADEQKWMAFKAQQEMEMQQQQQQQTTPQNGNGMATGNEPAMSPAA